MKPRACFRDGLAGSPETIDSSVSFGPWPDPGLLHGLCANTRPVLVLYGLGQGGASVVERFTTELHESYRQPFLVVLDPGADSRRRNARNPHLDVLLSAKVQLSAMWFVGELASPGLARLPAWTTAWIDRGVPLELFCTRPSDNTTDAWDEAWVQVTTLLRETCAASRMSLHVRDEDKAHWALLRALLERRKQAREGDRGCLSFPLS